MNLTLWTGSAGDQYADMFYGLIETATGRVCYGMAGKPSVVLLRPDEWKSLSHISPPLGESPETDYEPFGYELKPGEALVIFNEGFRIAPDKRGRAFGRIGLGGIIVGQHPTIGRSDDFDGPGMPAIARRQSRSGRRGDPGYQAGGILTPGAGGVNLAVTDLSQHGGRESLEISIGQRTLIRPHPSPLPEGDGTFGIGS